MPVQLRPNQEGARSEPPCLSCRGRAVPDPACRSSGASTANDDEPCSLAGPQLQAVQRDREDAWPKLGRKEGALIQRCIRLCGDKIFRGGESGSLDIESPSLGDNDALKRRQGEGCAPRRDFRE